jgi:hypothetical protein
VTGAESRAHGNAAARVPARSGAATRLMQRFVTDWLNGGDPSVCAEILAGSYTVHIGGHVLAGRPEYEAAVRRQLFERFPGVVGTAHDLVDAGDRVALRLTEHGATASGEPAAWRIIGLFWLADGVLVRNVTEEDYYGRRRQLVTGSCDPVDPPMAAPWSTAAREPDAEAETAVRRWLASGHPVEGDDHVVLDDAPVAAGTRPLVEVGSTEVRELFSAGRQVAFHAVQHGTYLGGLDGTEHSLGASVELGLTGIVRVDGSGTVSGHAVRDRLGLRGRLRR